MRIWQLLIAALLASALTSYPQERAQDVAEATSQSGWSRIEALEFPVDTPVAFMETRKTRLQRKPKTQRGTLWLDADGSFVMSITEPRIEERRLSNTTLSLTRPAKKGSKTRSTSLDPDRGAHQLLLSIMNVLQGNVVALQKSFSLAPDAGAGADPDASPEVTSSPSWVLSLTPTRKKLRKQLTGLTLRGRDNELVSIRAERGSTFQEIEIMPESEDTNSTGDQP